jgi:hypothetical protein
MGRVNHNRERYGTYPPNLLTFCFPEHSAFSDKKIPRTKSCFQFQRLRLSDGIVVKVLRSVKINMEHFYETKRS